MEPFVRVSGGVAPLDRVNVDTDQIIPAQFLKRIERTGFGQFLFYTWRLNADGSPNPDFILNKPGYEDTSILVAGRNFGAGSSREHAPWALLDYGIRAIIAPGFADIFHKNCFENGIAPIILPEAQVREIMEKAQAQPGYRLTVDLEHCRITETDQEHWPQHPLRHARRPRDARVPATRAAERSGRDRSGLGASGQDRGLRGEPRPARRRP